MANFGTLVVWYGFIYWCMFVLEVVSYHLLEINFPLAFRYLITLNTFPFLILLINEIHLHFISIQYKMSVMYVLGLLIHGWIIIICLHYK